MDGLDLEFCPGLNVIIGPRGAGKTTLLELIRHALGAAHADESRADAESRRIHALLGSGEVVLELDRGQDSVRVVVDADGNGRLSDVRESALVLGQNELEGIASDPSSRLRLIDLRAGHGTVEPDTGEIAGLTQLLHELRTRINDGTEVLAQRQLIERDLAFLERQEAELLHRASTETEEDSVKLKEAERQIREVQASVSLATAGLRALDEAAALSRQLERAVDTALTSLDSVTNWATQPLPGVRMIDQIISIQTDVLSFSAAVRGQLQEWQSRETALRGSAEPLRSSLERSEKGLGELTARIRNLRTQLARLADEHQRIGHLEERYQDFAGQREILLDHREHEEERRFAARLEVSRTVSMQLARNSTVSIEHLADSSDFRRLLATLLQGSGLRYSSVADAIAERLLPRQLLGLLESGGTQMASELTGLPVDRLARAFAFLDSPEALSAISEASLKDRVDFLLRDGHTVRSVEELSTGQKCAVTLPILLTEPGRALLLDQPEDHLDNAYLVDDVVAGITQRTKAGSQTIIATHNANIPVLGEASLVAVMNSDGRRGSVADFGEFDTPNIVKAITTIMEGGAAAFRRRAEFYKAFRGLE